MYCQAFEKVYAAAQQHKVSMRTAAYVVAIAQVAEVYQYRGGFAYNFTPLATLYFHSL